MRAFPLVTGALVAGALVGVCLAQAEVVLETVPVGNPGNPGEQARLANSDATFYGGVDYAFAMGKFEVTAGQYAEFLNAVAATDTNQLYNPRMDHDANPGDNGCNIQRLGTSGSFTYSVAPDWANRPVNYVSWADAVRFANWLHNGQPAGSQDLTTTEDGSYFIDGRYEGRVLDDVVREPDASWVIPTDAEWYKAAYHKNDGVTANYWNYGTASDSRPDNDLIDPDPGNHATFHEGFFGDPAGFTLGPPHLRTEAGAHENSASAYGTFDQAGNVMEFTETVPEWDVRRMRDGSWLAGGLMRASEIDDTMHSSDQTDFLGFRLARVGSANLTNLHGFDRVATYFEWDPRLGGGSSTIYDVVRGDLANLTGNATAVDLGPLVCIENDFGDESSQTNPDTDMPAPNTAFFYLVRYEEGPAIGPWGPGGGGAERAGTGGCAP